MKILQLLAENITGLQSLSESWNKYSLEHNTNNGTCTQYTRNGTFTFHSNFTNVISMYKHHYLLVCFIFASFNSKLYVQERLFSLITINLKWIHIFFKFTSFHLVIDKTECNQTQRKSCACQMELHKILLSGWHQFSTRKS